ncbi:MAG: hypothetical protein C5B51_30470 [Terriglobia bacterium]|nr:MAG: hypothetical protein C5B51_30470 [Terriglobia bacterium]
MMDHAEATRRLAAEQYLLGELSESEQEEFEKHYFDCPECAEALESGTALLVTARQVFREPASVPRPAPVPAWKRWLGLEWGFAPAAALAASLVLLVLAGYQNLVVIPGLRQRTESGELALGPAIAIRAARAAQTLTFSKRSPIFTVTIAHEWEEAYTRYAAELETATDHRVVLQNEIAATPADLSVSLRPSALPSGAYFLTIYGFRGGSSDRMSVARVPFTLTE